MVFDAGSVFLYVVGLFLLYLCCWIFIKPLKWLLRLGGSWLMGGAAVALWNFLAGGAGWGLALNPLTAMITGVLGVPGMILIFILTKIL